MARFLGSASCLLVLVLLGPACAADTIQSSGSGETSGSDDASETDEFDFGTALYRLMPVLCADCRSQDLRRFDGDVIGLWVTDVAEGAQTIDQAYGDLTPAGISTIAQLNEELWQAIVAEQVEIDVDCIEANPWIFLVLREQDAQIAYGIGCPPPQAAALDELYLELIADLAACQVNEWAIPHPDCTPVALTES
jgi:hypothetical protein